MPVKMQAPISANRSIFASNPAIGSNRSVLTAGKSLYTDAAFASTLRA